MERTVEARRIELTDGFIIRRLMPSRELRAVGPWLFFDHFGPVTFAPGRGLDVIPHPHINLSTVTYLFEGEIVHRDNLGSVQTIRPGAINLMRAGRGIAHSERTGPALRAEGHTVHGIQLWCGLPEDKEEIEPGFSHYAADELPTTTVDGAELRVMIGSTYGVSSPVQTLSPTLYAEASIPAGAELRLPEDTRELAVYPVSGRVRIGAAELPAHRLAVFGSDADALITALEDSRVIMIGGEPLGRRHMWWNFVSSRPERIEQAKADWRDGRFGEIPGEHEYHRLPEHDAFFDSER